MASESKSKDDGRIGQLEARVAHSFKHVKADKFRKSFYSPENMCAAGAAAWQRVHCVPRVVGVLSCAGGAARARAAALFRQVDTPPPPPPSRACSDAICGFLDNPAARVLYFVTDNVNATPRLPKRLPPKGKTVIVFKTAPEVVMPDMMTSHLLVSELQGGMLEHVERTLTDVWLPLLSNPANQAGWGEVASLEVVTLMHRLLSRVSIVIGQTSGRPFLPLPPVDANAKQKERVQLLEGAVITWSEQIKNVLLQDSELLLRQGMHPTPDVEIEFWKAKAGALNAIFEQLQSERVRKVLSYLDEVKSTYCSTFAKLCRDAFAARLEANDNVKYLRTLESLFYKLNHADSFPNLTELFKPIMHIVLLIWKNSRFYNTTPRLVVLIVEISNAIINQATGYVNGRQIFDLIEADDSTTAMGHLQTTIQVCEAFKATYFEYKATANAECPTNKWRVQHSALFVRLNAFLERCQDVLELTQTIVQFSRLSKIDVGGTKGLALTASVLLVHRDFESALAAFKAVPYDIMDVRRTEFDDDCHAFRNRVKELERRLGAIVTQAFDDCASIRAKFQLMDTFEGLLERPTLQDEVEKRSISLVQLYGADLKVVQELFFVDRDAPPISCNLPPIAGALTWCRALKGRIVQPMDKLRGMSRAILEREETKDVVNTFHIIISSLDDYENQKIEEWGSDVERSSQAKLKLPLLARHTDPGSGRRDLLRVNFDPVLVKLLREAKYFLLLDLAVPESALAIYKKAEEYRRQSGNLDLIVNMYNSMLLELLPVEAPLMQSYFVRISQVIIAGLSDITWKSAGKGVDEYIAECQRCVKSAHEVLFALKRNLGEIQAQLNKWSARPLFAPRKQTPKPSSPAEFNSAHEALKKMRYAEMKTGGADIDRKLKDSMALLKVQKTAREWRGYVDFVNDVVVDGLVRVVVTSLSHLQEALNPTEPHPLLCVTLNLRGSHVQFMPTIVPSDRGGEDEGPVRSVRGIVDAWVQSFFGVGTLFARLDDANGRYSKVRARRFVVTR